MRAERAEADALDGGQLLDPVSARGTDRAGRSDTRRCSCRPRAPRRSRGDADASRRGSSGSTATAGRGTGRRGGEREVTATIGNRAAGRRTGETRSPANGGRPTVAAGTDASAVVDDHRPPANTVAMDIKRVGSQPSAKGPADWFTGTVRIDPSFDRGEPARVSGASVTFEPGARTAWHTHPLGQTLVVTAGCGWAQRAGGPVEQIRPGDVVWFPPGEKHWHGADGHDGHDAYGHSGKARRQGRRVAGASQRRAVPRVNHSAGGGSAQCPSGLPGVHQSGPGERVSSRA